ncbi:Uncharacterised protein [Bordetella pertussis]|nr:Uncharacterised protein [Bordetella pertussis]
MRVSCVYWGSQRRMNAAISSIIWVTISKPPSQVATGSSRPVRGRRVRS